MKTLIIFAAIFIILVGGIANAQLTRTFEDSGANIEWGAGWKTESSALASGGTWRIANEEGVDLIFNFEGNAVSLIYAKGPHAPTAEIEIDGIKALEINASSDAYIGRVRYIIAQNLEFGKHTLKLRLISEGAKNGFAVDAFEVQTFESTKEAQFSWFWPFAAAVLIIFGIAFYKFYPLQAKVEIPKAAQPVKLKQKPAVEQNKRMQDIMRALDEKDKEIINYLLESKGKAKQSQIRNYLQMPRSTLSKRIAILEQRNIVETKEIGKTNLVKLTPWFSSGKEKGR